MPKLRSRKPFRKPLKKWQYTYSGWLKLIKCKEMTKKEEQAFMDRLWNDNKFAKKIHKEYEDWQAEEDDFRDEAKLEEEAIRSKKTGRHYSGKYTGGEYEEKDF